MGKMNVFGVDLKTHLRETGKQVPFLVTKCISEIDTRALHTKVGKMISLYLLWGKI